MDQYLKNVVFSLTFLKSFFNKFFFYELKYFLKNNNIFFFFSFKFLRKSAFRFYWKYIHRSKFLSKFISFTRKKPKQRKLEENISRSQYIEVPTKKKLELNDTHRLNLVTLILHNSINSAMAEKFKLNLFFKKVVLNYLLSITQFIIMVKCLNYKNVILSKFSKFLFKYKNLIMIKFLYLNKTRLYGLTSIFSLNSCKNFSLIREIYSNGFFFNTIKICLMAEYSYNKLHIERTFYYNTEDISNRLSFFKESSKIIALKKEFVLKFFKNLGKLLYRKFKLKARTSRRFISKKLRKTLRQLLRRLQRFNKNTTRFLDSMKKILRNSLLNKTLTNNKEKKQIRYNLFTFNTNYIKNYEPINWYNYILTTTI